MTRAISFLNGFAAAFTVIAVLLAATRQDPAPEAPAPEPRSAVQMLRAQRGTLSPWEELQMAIIYTESRFDPSALGSAQDAGLYQMTPVYVAEVNRIAGTDYAHADAFDPDKAVEMFALLQAHYNPAQDPDTAIRYHNRSAAYRAEVLRNLELIRRYEAARKHVTK